MTLFLTNLLEWYCRMSYRTCRNDDLLKCFLLERIRTYQVTVKFDVTFQVTMSSTMKHIFKLLKLEKPEIPEYLF